MGSLWEGHKCQILLIYWSISRHIGHSIINLYVELNCWKSWAGASLWHPAAWRSGLWSSSMSVWPIVPPFKTITTTRRTSVTYRGLHSDGHGETEWRHRESGRDGWHESGLYITVSEPTSAPSPAAPRNRLHLCVWSWGGGGSQFWHLSTNTSGGVSLSLSF